MSAFDHAIQIAEAVTNLARLKLNIEDRAVEDIARRRRAVCTECEFLNKKEDSCIVCTCPISLRTRSMKAGCVKGYWKPAKV